MLITVQMIFACREWCRPIQIDMSAATSVMMAAALQINGQVREPASIDSAGGT
jgi:hypothetical protein